MRSRDPQSKLVTARHLQRDEGDASQSPQIVFTNGCFDLLHRGHADFLLRCKSLGDTLVVGLNTDDSVRRIKGDTRPVTGERDRAFVLACLECVDYVILFSQDDPLQLIQSIQPDVLVKGGDWPPEAIVGRDVVRARGGAVYSLPLLPNYSTSDLIRRIASQAGGRNTHIP
jgi:rfaE bifunctional protein nucleotidyltransferase chain/domain